MKRYRNRLRSSQLAWGWAPWWNPPQFHPDGKAGPSLGLPIKFCMRPDLGGTPKKG